MWMTKDPAFIRTTSKLRAVAAHSTAVNMDSAQPLSYFFFSTPDGLDSQLQSLISSILLCILRLASLSIICSKSAEAFQRIFKMRSYFRMHAHSFIWLLQAVAIGPFHPGIRRITILKWIECSHITILSTCHHVLTLNTHHDVTILNSCAPEQVSKSMPLWGGTRCNSSSANVTSFITHLRSRC